MKHLIVGNGGIASHIAHAKTVDNKPIVVDEEERGISINEGLPQIVQNIIDSTLTQYHELTTPLSGREKRRERRKQNRKNK
jgi:hypothetical protein